MDRVQQGFASYDLLLLTSAADKILSVICEAIPAFYIVDNMRCFLHSCFR